MRDAVDSVKQTTDTGGMKWLSNKTILFIIL
jgi:hypothetical protein